MRDDEALSVVLEGGHGEVFVQPFARDLTPLAPFASMKPDAAPGVRSLEISAARPDGTREVLLWVKNENAGWPTPYAFRQPIALPAGTVLRATALLGLAVNLLVMYPGMMMWDSLDQLLQARDGSLNDWQMGKSGSTFRPMGTMSWRM